MSKKGSNIFDEDFNWEIEDWFEPEPKREPFFTSKRITSIREGCWSSLMFLIASVTIIGILILGGLALLHREELSKITLPAISLPQVEIIPTQNTPHPREIQIPTIQPRQSNPRTIQPPNRVQPQNQVEPQHEAPPLIVVIVGFGVGMLLFGGGGYEIIIIVIRIFVR